MLRWAEPFDQYGGDEAAMLNRAWAQNDGAVLSTAQPRTGAWALRFDWGTGPGFVRRVFGDNLAVASIGFGLFLDQLPTHENNFTFSNDGGLILARITDAANTPQLNFELGTNGQIRLYQGVLGGSLGFPGGTLLAESDPTVLVAAASYGHIEFVMGCDSSAGFAEIRYNGVTIMNETGLDTDPMLSGVFAQWATGQVGLTGSGCTGYIDDLTCGDNSGSYNTEFIGDKKLYYLPPTSDLTPEDFTPSAGSDSYAMLDEAPPNDADYISLAGTTGKTVVGHAALPGDVAAISAVVALQRSWKDDAGTCDMKPGICQGSTYASGAGQPQTTVAGYYDQVFEVDPVSGVPFTPSDVNSLAQVIERSA